MPNTVTTAVPSGVRAPSSRARRHRWSRAVAAGVLAAGLAVGVGACGFEAQTLQPYTPAAGVNFDLPTDTPVLNARDVRIISAAEGRGFLSVTLISSQADQLTSVTGTTLGPDGAESGPVEVELAAPVELGPTENPLVLADLTPRLGVTGEGVVPGLTARLTMTFAEAGEATLVVPITNDEDLRP